MKGSLQIKSNHYYCVFRVNGKQIWESTGIKVKKGNKRKAEQALTNLLAEYSRNPNMFDKIEFTDYIKKWLANVKNSVDTITYEGYKQYAEKHIIPYFSEKKIILQDIKISDIEGYYNAKAIGGRLDGKSGGLSLRTIKLHGVVLNLVLKQAIYERLIPDNPCAYAKYPKTIATQKKEPNFYTINQCNTLLECIKGTPLYNMVYITFIYGLRRSELLGLKWDAIDFENNTISIQHTVVMNSTVVRKDKTKNVTSKRKYPLLPDVKMLLEKMLTEQTANKSLLGNCYIDNDYVFVKADGSTYYPSYPTHASKKVLEKHNLPFIRWHDLRHSTASMLIERGWHMKDISEWLGHSDIGTTMNIYGHISMEHKKELGDSLIGLLDN